jgi:hypothetical protein
MEGFAGVLELKYKSIESTAAESTRVFQLAFSTKM